MEVSHEAERPCPGAGRVDHAASGAGDGRPSRETHDGPNKTGSSEDTSGEGSIKNITYMNDRTESVVHLSG